MAYCNVLTMPTTLPDLDQLDREALKDLIRAQHEQLCTREGEIQHLKLLLAKLQRMQFGRKSERVARQIEQLELRLEELQANQADRERQTESKLPPTVVSVLPPVKKPARRPLPEHLPRKTHVHEPKASKCPECGGELRKLGEDVSEVLEYVPARFHVIRYVRPKLSCAGCDCIVQAPAPV